MFSVSPVAKGGKVREGFHGLGLEFLELHHVSMRAARNSSVGFSSALVSLNQRMAVEPQTPAIPRLV